MSASIFALGLLAACGGPELSCPEPALPSPTPTYVDTLESLVLVPARANLRDASTAEVDSFASLTAQTQAACGESPPGGACDLGTLRTALVALPAPDHPGVFTGIEASLDAAIASAQSAFAPADRDCAGQTEAACDARAITGAFARAVCGVRNP